jgi:hypothetical protein
VSGDCGAHHPQGVRRRAGTAPTIGE